LKKGSKQKKRAVLYKQLEEKAETPRAHQQKGPVNHPMEKGSSGQEGTKELTPNRVKKE